MNNKKSEAVLAIDFSLGRLDVCLGGDEPPWRWGHRAYANNWPGFCQLKQELLQELKEMAVERLTIVGESTGPYWWPAFYQFSRDESLQPFSPSLALLNPARVKGYRKALPEQDKTDKDDPHLLARYYRAIGLDHPYQFPERYLRLRFLSRAYARLMHTLASEKAYLLSVLFLSASEYQQRQKKPFSNLFGVTSQAILDEFAHIQALAAMPLDELTSLLARLSTHTLARPAENAAKLQQVAQDSYPLPPHLSETLHQVVQLTLAHIRFLSDNQKVYRQLIEAELDTLPEAKLALDFKGLGPILVAGCLAEIQHTARFTTGTKYDRKRKRYRPRTYGDGQAAVAKLAGLWWPKSDSGQLEDQQRQLARERNPYLRYWFVQAAYTLQRYQPEYGAFYRQKYNQAQHHPHKRALILTARKAVRLIFALLHKGQLACLEEGRLT